MLKFREPPSCADRLQKLRSLPKIGICFSEVNRKSKSALPSNHIYSQPKLMNKATLFYQTLVVKLIKLCIKTTHQNGKQIRSFFILPQHLSSGMHRFFRYCPPESLQLAEQEIGPHTPLHALILCELQNGADIVSVATGLIPPLLYASVFTPALCNCIFF